MEKLRELNKQNFTDQRKFIHKIVKMMGDIRENLSSPLPDWSHMTLEAYDYGIRTPEISGPINRITYNIIDNDLSFYHGLKIQTINLSGLSGNEIFQKLSEELQKYNVILRRHSIYNNEIINKLDRARENFVRQLCFFDKILKDFHASVSKGEKTPLRLWPNDFDNAFIWKSGKKVNGVDEELGIGASNGDDHYELPYFYITIRPFNPSAANLNARGASFHSEGFHGYILPYSEIQKENSIEDQERLIKDFLNNIFDKLSA